LTIVAKEVDLPIAEKVSPEPVMSMPKGKFVKRPEKILTSIARSLRRKCCISLIGVTEKVTLR